MLKKFKKIYIEITNTCNLSCHFCPKTGRKSEFMETELFKMILNKVKGHSEYLYFHVMGEPLLHSKLGLFLDLCQQEGFKVNITSNGTLIEKQGDLLLSKPSLRQINFSLHSFDANDYEVPMHTYINNILSFVKKSRQQRKPLISLRLWNYDDTGSNPRNRAILEQIQKELDIEAILNETLIQGRGVKLAENVYLNYAKKFDWPDMNREDISTEGYCHGLRDQVAVLVDGTVVPCCLDGEGNIALGNIIEQDLSSIVEGERAINLYEGFSRREAVEDLCKKCGYRTRFGGK